jgi:hypothetical protein
MCGNGKRERRSGDGDSTGTKTAILECAGFGMCLGSGGFDNRIRDGNQLLIDSLPFFTLRHQALETELD